MTKQMTITAQVQLALQTLWLALVQWTVVSGPLKSNRKRLCVVIQNVFKVIGSWWTGSLIRWLQCFPHYAQCGRLLHTRDYTNFSVRRLPTEKPYQYMRTSSKFSSTLRTIYEDNIDPTKHNLLLTKNSSHRVRSILLPFYPKVPNSSKSRMLFICLGLIVFIVRLPMHSCLSQRNVRSSIWFPVNERHFIDTSPRGNLKSDTWETQSKPQTDLNIPQLPGLPCRHRYRDDPEASALLSELVIVGRPVQIYRRYDGPLYNISLYVTQVFKRPEMTMYPVLSQHLLRLGQFSDYPDHGRCRINVELNRDYMFFLDRPDWAGYCQINQLPVVYSRKLGKRVKRLLRMGAYPLQMRPLHHAEQLVVDEGSDLLLTCRVRGRPTPLISWFHNETEIKVPWRPELRQGIIQASRNLAKLQLGRLHMTDTGNYTCLAENLNGHIKKSVEVIVKPLTTTPAPTTTAMTTPIITTSEPRVTVHPCHDYCYRGHCYIIDGKPYCSCITHYRGARCHIYTPSNAKLDDIATVQEDRGGILGCKTGCETTITRILLVSAICALVTILLLCLCCFLYQLCSRRKRTNTKLRPAGVENRSIASCDVPPPPTRMQTNHAYTTIPRMTYYQQNRPYQSSSTYPSIPNGEAAILETFRSTQPRNNRTCAIPAMCFDSRRDTNRMELSTSATSTTTPAANENNPSDSPIVVRRDRNSNNRRIKSHSSEPSLFSYSVQNEHTEPVTMPNLPLTRSGSIDHLGNELNTRLIHLTGLESNGYGNSWFGKKPPTCLPAPVPVYGEWPTSSGGGTVRTNHSVTPLSPKMNQSNGQMRTTTLDGAIMSTWTRPGLWPCSSTTPHCLDWNNHSTMITDTSHHLTCMTQSAISQDGSATVDYYNHNGLGVRVPMYQTLSKPPAYATSPLLRLISPNPMASHRQPK